jgi:SAM-dependent methyltransferase
MESAKPDPHNASGSSEETSTDRCLLIFQQRASRRRAREVAQQEAMGLLRDLHPAALSGGPLSEQGGRFWITIPPEALPAALKRLPFLGYSLAVERAIPTIRAAEVGHVPLVRWRRQTYRLASLYREDPAAFREEAPDRRTFLLESQGEVRAVRGYRGSSEPGSRRALPVEDARMLVNLVAGAHGFFLDPFAGAGGIAREAIWRGWAVFSCDIAPELRCGLTEMGARHCLADARALPFPDRTFAAIATEPPYDPESLETVCAAMREMGRVLQSGGRLAMLCALEQRDRLRAAVPKGFISFLDSPIDRKGTPCAVLAWIKE